MSIDARRPWVDDRPTAQERADLLLPRLSLDQRLAQLGCDFPRDITSVAEMTDRHPHGIGVVSAL
jgi:beta-glucosidase